MNTSLHPCDHDCLHCARPDCTCNDGLTPWESSVVHGALGGWENESIDRNVSRLLAQGYSSWDILGCLGISQYDMSQSLERISNRRKNAARDCNHKAAQRKLHTEIING